VQLSVYFDGPSLRCVSDDDFDDEHVLCNAKARIIVMMIIFV
jgi:hypothetical protein